MNPLYSQHSKMIVYESSAEFNLNRATESIRLAKQAQKRELEQKDEEINSLKKQIDVLKLENREYRRHSDKNSELASCNQTLSHELSMYQAENERLQDEIDRLKEYEMDSGRLRQDLTVREDQIRHLEAELMKANHIIKNLIKKLSHSRSHEHMRRE